MSAYVGPSGAFELDQDRVRERIDEAVGDQVGMLGDEQGGRYIAGGEPLDVGGAHPMEKGDAVVAADADNQPIIEAREARAGFDRLIFASGLVIEGHQTNYSTSQRH